MDYRQFHVQLCFRCVLRQRLRAPSSRRAEVMREFLPGVRLTASRTRAEAPLCHADLSTSLSHRHHIARRDIGTGAGYAHARGRDVVLRDQHRSRYWRQPRRARGSRCALSSACDRCRTPIGCGAPISAHHHQRMRQWSTRATGSAAGRGSTREGFRLPRASKSSTART